MQPSKLCIPEQNQRHRCKTELPKPLAKRAFAPIGKTVRPLDCGSRRFPDLTRLSTAHRLLATPSVGSNCTPARARTRPPRPRRAEDCKSYPPTDGIMVFLKKTSQLPPVPQRFCKMPRSQTSRPRTCDPLIKSQREVPENRELSKGVLPVCDAYPSWRFMGLRRLAECSDRGTSPKQGGPETREDANCSAWCVASRLQPTPSPDGLKLRAQSSANPSRPDEEVSDGQ